MRAMTILTAVWIACGAFAFISLAVVRSHAIDSLSADLVAPILAVNLVCYLAAIALTPVTIIGWPIALIARLTRRRAPCVDPPVVAPTEPGFYRFDERTRTYQRIGP